MYSNGINYCKRKGILYEATLHTPSVIYLTRYDMDATGVIPSDDKEITFNNFNMKEVKEYEAEKARYESFRPGFEKPEVENTSFSDELAKLLAEMEVLLQKKNKDYGSSYDKSVEKYGEVVALIRLGDKFNRIDNLILTDSQGEVDEKIEETLLDLVGYGIIELVRRRRVQHGKS